MINETMARVYWPKEDPGRQGDPARRLRRTAPHRRGGGGRCALPGPGRARAPAVLPALHAGRLAGDERRGPHHRHARHVHGRRSRRRWPSVLPDRPVSGVETMEDVVHDSTGSRRFPMLLLSVFSVLALVLAAVGIVGVVGHSVAQRTHEIGIRMALGAGTLDVLRLMVNSSMVWVLVGLAWESWVPPGSTRLLAECSTTCVRSTPVVLGGVSALLAGGAAGQLSAGAARRQNRPPGRHCGSSNELRSGKTPMCSTPILVRQDEVQRLQANHV